MIKLIGITLVLAALVNGAPLTKKSKQTFKEAEYDITLRKAPGEKRYFIKANEMPLYESQFAKIQELGNEINCKIRGDCQNEKRGKIHSGNTAHKKSMFDGGEPGESDAENSFGDQPNVDDANGKKPSPNEPAQYGQQPQMDIKLSDPEKAAIQNGAASSLSGPVNFGPGGNDDIIQNSVNSKMNFMDAANKGSMSQGPPGADMTSGLTQNFLGNTNLPGMAGNPGGAGGPMMGGLPGLQGGGMGGGPEMQAPGEGKGQINFCI